MTRLRDLLSPEQWIDWEREKTIREVSPEGRLWSLSIHSGVRLLDPDTKRIRVSMCVHPIEELSIFDWMAAMLLAIRWDEHHVIAVANASAALWSEKELAIRQKYQDEEFARYERERQIRQREMEERRVDALRSIRMGEINFVSVSADVDGNHRA